MKATVGRTKDLRAQVESTYGGGFPVESTVRDWMVLANEALPNATPLTSEVRISVNEYFGPTSNDPLQSERKEVRSLSWGENLNKLLFVLVRAWESIYE